MLLPWFEDMRERSKHLKKSSCVQIHQVKVLKTGQRKTSPQNPKKSFVGRNLRDYLGEEGKKESAQQTRSFLLGVSFL